MRLFATCSISGGVYLTSACRRLWQLRLGYLKTQMQIFERQRQTHSGELVCLTVCSPSAELSRIASSDDVESVRKAAKIALIRLGSVEKERD